MRSATHSSAQPAREVAAKLYTGGGACPIVIRPPTGAAWAADVTPDPEGFCPHGGDQVVCLRQRRARALLKAAIRDPNPVMMFEHKFLYRRIKEVLPEGDAVGRLGEARVMRPGDRITLIGYGATTWTCMEVAEELAKEGVEAEVVDLRTLVPTTRRLCWPR